MRKNKKQIHFWVSEEELASLKYDANLYGLTVTDYIKACVGLITIPQPFLDSVKQKQTNPPITKEEEEYYANLQIITKQELAEIEQQELEDWIAKNQ